MAIWKWLGWGKKNGEEGPLRDAFPHALRVGYLVDYDTRTWEVVGYSTYDRDGALAEEWVLSADNKTAYLKRQDDGGVVKWVLTEDISLGQLSKDLAGPIMEHDSPPEVVQYAGDEYRLAERGGGLYREDSEGKGEAFVNWSYCDRTGKQVLCVTQWGERDFKAVAGQVVEEHQFTNALPQGDSP